MNHEWQLRRKYAKDTVMRCAVCGALRADGFHVSADEWGFDYRRKGHVRWHREEPPCGPKPAAAPPVRANVSRAAVAEVAAELRKKADDAYQTAVAAQNSGNQTGLTMYKAVHAAYATAAEAIERVLK